MLLRRPARYAVAFSALIALLPVIASCAASRAPMKDADAPLPNDVDGTLVALDEAEGELVAALGGRPRAMARSEAKSEEIQAGGAEASPPPPAQPSETEAAPTATPPRDDLQAEGRAAPAPSPCARACRALASMRRATDHLCGLSGETDPRCSGARERVRSASERVSATCPPCADE